ncbi:MAG: sulfatase-like hydrolase/transferase [Candidatus Latescibacteria bacterium]|nr:sulfatase-like hydrolase/transferase [Candidatus Latescibacterota bacterium]
MAAEQKNILLILTDQQRWDSLGCYGTPGVHTPHLDRLAAAGALYDCCYVNGTICTPSRACLWTGKHIPGHGVQALHDCLPEDEVFFSKRLQAAGYDTALFGKLHVSGHYREYERRHPNDGFGVYEWASDPFGPWGMDNAYLRWLEGRDPALREEIRQTQRVEGSIPASSHMTTWAAERTVDFLSRRSPNGAPFFCCMSVFDPHSPYINHPKEAEALLDQARLPPVMAGDQSFAGRPVAHDLERRYGNQVPEADTLAKWRVGYHAGIAHIDAEVGRVLAVLADRGLADDTVVIFTSDHGDMLGDHGLMTKGAYFYDACTRVPMIVRGPDVEVGRVAAPVQWHDIAGTCLQLAGQTPEEVRAWSPDGVSLLDRDGLRRRNRAVCLYRNSGMCTKPKEDYRGYYWTFAKRG